MRLRLPAIIALLSAPLAAVAAAPAQAVPDYGRVDFPNGVSCESCTDVTYDLTLNLPPGTTSWDGDVELVGRDGLVEDDDLVFGSGRVGTIAIEAFMCFDPGTYTVRGDFTAYDFNDNETKVSLTPTTTSWRKPNTKTKIALKDNAQCGKSVTSVVTVTDERPAGYFPTDFTKVLVQYRGVGTKDWKKWRSDYTDDGTARILIKFSKGDRRGCGNFEIRAITFGTDERSGSESNPIKVKPKRA